MLLQPDQFSPTKALTAIAAERQRRDFITFAQRAWHIIEPKTLQWNWHLDAIAEHLVYVTQGEIRFLQIQVPPRMTKSLLCSVLWPAWHWLHKPEHQFLAASYSGDLSIRDAVLSRRLISSPWYQRFYANDFFLLGDSNKKQRYSNSRGGYRISTSVGGISTGEGGDIQLLDDPHNAAKIESDAVRNGALSWHDNAWRSRVNDPNRAQKVYAGQRTHDADIMGHVLRQEAKRWVVLMLPMEYDKGRKCITYANKGKGANPANKIFEDPRKVDGELLNPRRFDKETAQAERDIMSKRAWQAQYQQQPEGQGGLILKRDWWREWKWQEHHRMKVDGRNKERPLPSFFEIIQVYDTAFEEDEEADFTARTTWGLFENPDPELNPRSNKPRENRICAMLLERYKEQVGFPELRKEAIDSFEEWKPDRVLIEKKSSGHSLIQELRKQDVPAVGVLITGERKGIKHGEIPSRKGKALVGRAHVASLMLEKGCIYYVPRNWSFDVIDECAKFPQGEHDDQVSSCVMAWQYMRRYHDLQLPDDRITDDINPFNWQKRTLYA